MGLDEVFKYLDDRFRALSGEELKNWTVVPLAVQSENLVVLYYPAGELGTHECLEIIHKKGPLSFKYSCCVGKDYPSKGIEDIVGFILRKA